ncbi:MAG: class I SAM-dependent methyltransferase [Euryarchaeota archaeon]|nr:class I SAM-dependent methyltransferase [Euryarchaeota archaeon]MCG2734886.1 class I SAM-dependent methyltransferase [Candidatus Methanoperedenaceae archaeon]
MPGCKICDTNLEVPFLSIGNSPLSNAYLSKDDLHKMEPNYPLEVYVCEKCYLVQLEEFETAKNIFSSDYAYFSSYSESWLQHCKNYTEMMITRFGFDKNSFVVEIGSNDGYLLQYFRQHGIPVLGIEPASNTAQVAIKKGIPTDITFFDMTYAKKIRKTGKLADLIIGNNVLAHNPNLNDFVNGLKLALKSDGVITMEFPHLLKLIEGNQFDTIYHEHFSYFSFYSVHKLFASHNLELFDVEEIPTHGGSLRIYAGHKDDKSKVITNNIRDLLKKEEIAGIFDLNTYYNFSEKVKLTKRKLLQFLIQAKNEGKSIVGYGAPAKGNTLLNYCGIGTDFLDYTVDRNPYKQDKYLPGTHIPIKHPDKIKEDEPDYVLILPWNIKDEIMEQMSYIREWGGKFVIPIPEVVVLE